MGNPFTVAQKYLDKSEPADSTSSSFDGSIIAVEICSKILQANIWLAFEDSFNPKDGQAVYYAHELESLKDKTPEQLREIQKAKLAFGRGSRPGQ